jgi:hypothetical protein
MTTLTLGACTPGTAINLLSSIPIVVPTPTPTGFSPRAAKILLKENFPPSALGSFDPASLPVSGAPATSGSLGLQAVQIFNPDNTIMGTQTYTSSQTVAANSNWPNWLKSFDIGISGSSNVGAKSRYCAGFATTAEASATNCNLGPVTAPIPSLCGAPYGQYRVSEADCSTTDNAGVVATPGIGGPSDGVYLRAVFNRDNLGPNENILVVLEYLPGALNPAPINPSACFNPITGQLNPELCSDFTWRAYLKNTLGENPIGSITIQPYLLLVPPFLGSVLGSSASNLGNSGTNPTARQFILPLANSSTLSVLQITRTGSTLDSVSSAINNSNLLRYCAPGSIPGTGANTPLCAGIIFYSITFYRI